MEGLQISFFLKASVLQSKAAFMGCFLPLLLILLLAFLQLESAFLPTIWHALPGLLEEPALAFLLLNCVTLTIIASSKLGSEERGHELEEDEGQLAMNVIENGDEQGKDVVETAIGLILYLDTPVENGHQKGHDVAEIVVKPALYVPTPFNKTRQDIYKSKKGNFLRRSWSLNASFEYKAKHDPIKLSHVKESVKEKQHIRSRGRLGSRKNEKVGLHPNKPLSTELLKKQLTRGSLTSSNAADREGTHDHDEKPVLTKERCTITVDEQCMKGCSGPAGVVADQQGLRQAEHPAAAAAETAHPSMEEVWAAIMSATKNDDSMTSCMQVRKRSKKSISKAGKQPPPAPAPTGMATRGQTDALDAPTAAAAEYTPTAAITSLKPAGKVPKKTAKSRALAAAAKTQAVPGNGCTEMEELRQRADEFIQRFNRQMRLQREESLQAPPLRLQLICPCLQ